jgi:hypothetical protein
MSRIGQKDVLMWRAQFQVEHPHTHTHTHTNRCPGSDGMACSRGEHHFKQTLWLQVERRTHTHTDVRRDRTECSCGEHHFKTNSSTCYLRLFMEDPGNWHKSHIGMTEGHRGDSRSASSSYTYSPHQSGQAGADWGMWWPLATPTTAANTGCSREVT